MPTETSIATLALSTRLKASDVRTVFFVQSNVRGTHHITALCFNFRSLSHILMNNVTRLMLYAISQHFLSKLAFLDQIHNLISLDVLSLYSQIFLSNINYLRAQSSGQLILPHVQLLLPNFHLHAFTPSSKSLTRKIRTTRHYCGKLLCTKESTKVTLLKRRL